MSEAILQSARPAYDRTKLVELFGEDPKTLAEVEREFLETARVAEREIVNTTDCNQIARAAHRLKGASGMIGAAYVAKAVPDGYTLYFNASIHSINPLLYRSTIKYDAVADFTAVSMVAQGALIFSVNPQVAATTVQQLIDTVKAEPNRYSFVTSGYGSAGHLGVAQFLSQTGLASLNIPIALYKGGGPALTDVMGGHVHMAVATVLTAAPMLRTGKLKALATGGAKRLSTMPELPTVAEAGIPSYEASIWWGWASAGGTPEPILQKINTEVAAILKLPETGKRMAAEGAESEASTIPQIREMIKADLVKWAKVAADAKMPKI